MQGLTDDGLEPRHLAQVLSTLAEDRACQSSRAGDAVDLVWTGPEPPGTASRDTPVVVRELFAAAQSEVLVAGFAVYQGRTIFRALADRMDERPDLSVRMFLDVQRRQGDTSIDSAILSRYAHDFRAKQWPGKRLPEVYYDPRSLARDVPKRACLHAKCVVVDRTTAFVSSANFTEAAQVRNIEVGVLIRSPRFSTQLAEHFEGLLAQHLLLRVEMM